MKKVLLSLLMVAGLGFAASAQNDPIKIGVKAGVTFPNISISPKELDLGLKSNVSFYVGGTADIPVSDIFSVQPGLSLIGKGAKLVETDEDSGTSNTTINTMYLEIPVNLMANFKVGEGKVFVGAGPYYGFAISGKYKSATQDEKIKFGSDEDSDMKRGDFGLNFLAGYQLSNGFNIHAGYGLGLSNISIENSGDFKMKNKVFSVGVGYSF